MADYLGTLRDFRIINLNGDWKARNSKGMRMITDFGVTGFFRTNGNIERFRKLRVITDMKRTRETGRIRTVWEADM
ncbi:MAG: hypothetical protein IJM27_12665 [Eubacterium sp.]|nr:hypothetical protein [Eubacterium sp.]